MQKTLRRSIALAVAALWSLPASAGDLSSPTVYVAPGGVYIGSAQVYVAPNPGNGYAPNVVPGPAYVPGYGPPAAAYVPEPYGPDYAVPAPAPAYVPAPVYGAPPLSAYGAQPMVRPRAYVSPYPVEYAPRPPAVVPYNGGGRCVAAYGRWICN